MDSRNPKGQSWFGAMCASGPYLEHAKQEIAQHLPHGFGEHGAEGAAVVVESLATGIVKRATAATQRSPASLTPADIEHAVSSMSAGASDAIPPLDFSDVQGQKFSPAIAKPQKWVPSTEFPETSYQILALEVLQMTDFKDNKNKYYCLELHSASVGSKTMFRVFTHYGRTDDLIKDPERAGKKEVRTANSLQQGKLFFWNIRKEKTSDRKGYHPISLTYNKVGSPKARGLPVNAAAAEETTVERVELDAGQRRLVSFLYEEAKSALQQALAATVTPRGIETPIGVLSREQVERGEAVLQDLAAAINAGGSVAQAKLQKLTSLFFTEIPHRLGRARNEIATQVLDTMEKIEAKQDLCQLMKDMLSVIAASGGAGDSDLAMKYHALKTHIRALGPSDAKYAEIRKYVEESQIKRADVEVVNVYQVTRPEERGRFTRDMPNQRLLFHGSRTCNFVGLLSRGILMPRIVVSMGVKRTDYGLLGNGIYFGDRSCTAAQYAHPGSAHTRMMLLCNVALGESKKLYEITAGITSPPEGYQSVHGVRKSDTTPSAFKDDEYVIFDSNQQEQAYLVEFRLRDTDPAFDPAILVSQTTPESSSTPQKAATQQSSSLQGVTQYVELSSEIQASHSLRTDTATAINAAVNLYLGRLLPEWQRTQQPITPADMQAGLTSVGALPGTADIHATLARIGNSASNSRSATPKTSARSSMSSARSQLASGRSVASSQSKRSVRWLELGGGKCMYGDSGADSSEKIYSFDVDNTLTVAKSGKKFITSGSDWKWRFPNVCEKISELANAGYKIVIFTNQKNISLRGVGEKKRVKEKLEGIMQALPVPCQCFVATGDGAYRKPQTGMWTLAARHNGGVAFNPLESHFVGDAAGRPAEWKEGMPADFSNSDLMFAQAAGVIFHTPEEVFLGESPLEVTPAGQSTPGPSPSLDLPGVDSAHPPQLTEDGLELFPDSTPAQEMVLLVGGPASGKSTFFVNHMESRGYVRVNRDTLGTMEACLSAARSALQSGSPVCIDNTNVSVEARKPFIALASEMGVPCRAFVMNTPFELTKQLNMIRSVKSGGEQAEVPLQALFGMRKRYEQPTAKEEGLTQVRMVNFVPVYPEEDTETGSQQLPEGPSPALLYKGLEQPSPRLRAPSLSATVPELSQRSSTYEVEQPSPNLYADPVLPGPVPPSLQDSAVPDYVKDSPEMSSSLFVQEGEDAPSAALYGSPATHNSSQLYTEDAFKEVESVPLHVPLDAGASHILATGPAPISSPLQVPSTLLAQDSDLSFANSGGHATGVAACYEKFSPIYESLKAEEDEIRGLFATDRFNPRISDPHLLLVDAFAEYESFRGQEWTPLEEALPKIPPTESGHKFTPGEMCIVKEEEFKHNWERLTNGQFAGMDWDHVFVAGGAVLACLLPDFEKNMDTPGFRATDIDMFLYDVTPAQANDKLRHIYEVLRKNITSGGGGQVMRTQHAVTILHSYPNRHVQIVLRIYKSPAEVLIGFDVDSCCVGFDGSRAWVHRRAQRAMVKRFNIVDMSRRSLTYEVRLNKYRKRGFGVAVPTLDRMLIDEGVLDKKVSEVEGLAKLLVLEHTTEQREIAANARARKRQSEKAKYEEQAKEEGSDYNNILIPWGPYWNSFRIVDLLNKKDRAQFFSRIKLQHHRHILATGIENIFDGKSCWCAYCRGTAGKEWTEHAAKHGSVPIQGDGGGNESFVSGELRWLEENPGTQLLTGSFHPLPAEFWERDAYGPNYVRSLVSKEGVPAVSELPTEPDVPDVPDVPNVPAIAPIPTPGPMDPPVQTPKSGRFATLKKKISLKRVGKPGDAMDSARSSSSTASKKSTARSVLGMFKRGKGGDEQ